MQPSESLIIFDDVFVPWERVFMCGEWQYSQTLAYAFASYHRLFGTCKMTGTLELMTGAASLIAEYNGVDKVPHVRKKLAWMAYITETVSIKFFEKPVLLCFINFPRAQNLFWNFLILKIILIIYYYLFKKKKFINENHNPSGFSDAPSVSDS